MTSKQESFYLWRCLPNGEVIKVGLFALEQFQNGKIDNLQFQYTKEYIKRDDAISLDPLNAPLTDQLLHYETNGHYLPGFIDDCLPDDWGRRVLALILSIKYINTLTILNNVNNTLIGDILITSSSYNNKPTFSKGVNINEINQVLKSGWNGHLDLSIENFQYFSMLKTGSSGIGGARPKLLVSDNEGEWIYKFNRSNDIFDVAIAEWASLQVSKKAGLITPDCFITTIGERKCLKIKRFDVSPNGGRFHLLTLNSLLKNRYTQEDPFSASYEDIGKIIRKYCINPNRDIQQLFGQVLLNGQIANTDDHLRNFSLINRGKGWELSPVYDILPSQDNDSFHQITILNKPYIPSLDQAEYLGKALGINKADSLKIAQNVKAAISKFHYFLKKAGASDEECKKILMCASLASTNG